MPSFTPHQDDALKAVADWLKAKPGRNGTPPVFRLFGYAGTGKTTLARHIAEDVDTLAAIGLAIASKREEAKTARTTSGIETTWKECEEAYVGIDDANRHEFQDAKWSKPMSMDSRLHH